MRRLQYPSQNNADNLNNVRCETSSISRKKGGGGNILTDETERQYEQEYQRNREA